jgi:uncharacterized protein YqgV (UPF0045/DUF77 family)
MKRRTAIASVIYFRTWSMNQQRLIMPTGSGTPSVAFSVSKFRNYLIYSKLRNNVPPMLTHLTMFYEPLNQLEGAKFE